MNFEGHHKNSKESKVEETIAAAAIEYKGEIYAGGHHGVAFEALEDEHPDHKNDFKDGYVTSTGRFVDREEALKIAQKQRQHKGKGQRSLDSGDVHYHG